MARTATRITPRKKASPPAPAPGVKDSKVTFETTEGFELHGALSRVTRHAVVFELYSPNVMPRYSEALEKFKIILRERVVYSGRAVVRNLLDAGNKIVCEATLNESDWADVDFELLFKNEAQIGSEFKTFLNEWQKLYKVSPEFKVAIADMQTFLHDLRLWLEQVELGVQAQPKEKREESEIKILQALQEPVLPNLASLFERFERLTSKIEKDSELAHSLYVKRLLHPLVLSSPFMRRTFEKPLGYAGDYEMVNMMARDPYQGGSIFAKILNTFFLNTPPVVAHRNRIDSLAQQLHFETYRTSAKGRTTKVFNLGCGPALEIQRFLPESPLSGNVEFTLLDFNNETVEYTQRILGEIMEKNNCGGTGPHPQKIRGAIIEGQVRSSGAAVLISFIARGCLIICRTRSAKNLWSFFTNWPRPVDWFWSRTSTPIILPSAGWNTSLTGIWFTAPPNKWARYFQKT